MPARLRLSPASQSPTRLQWHKAARSIRRDQGFLLSRAPWHSSAPILGTFTPSGQVKGQDAGPRSGPGQRPGRFLRKHFAVCFICNWKREARLTLGRTRQPCLTWGWQNPLSSVKVPFPPHRHPAFVWEAGGDTFGVTQSPVSEGTWRGLRDWFRFAHCWDPTDLGGVLQMYISLKPTPGSPVLAPAVAGWVTLGKAVTKQSSCCLPSFFLMHKSSPKKVSFNRSPKLDLPGEISTNATSVAPREWNLNNSERAWLVCWNPSL